MLTLRRKLISITNHIVDMVHHLLNRIINLIELVRQAPGEEKVNPNASMDELDEYRYVRRPIS